MPIRLLILALAASMFAFRADTATPPPAPSLKMLSMSAAPDAATQQALDAYVSYQFKQIAEADAEGVKDARTTLVTMLGKTEVTPVFQQAFLASAKPKVAAIVDGKDAFRITNALLVLRQIRSPEAFDLVLAQATIATQKDERVRIQAASMLPTMVTRRAVQPEQLGAAARRVRDALDNETSWATAAEDFDCLSKMAAEAVRAKLNAEAANVRGEMVRGLDAVQDRVKGDATMNGALLRALVSLRDQVLKMSEQERKQLADALKVGQPDSLLAEIAKSDAPKGETVASQHTAVVNLANVIQSILVPSPKKG